MAMNTVVVTADKLKKRKKRLQILKFIVVIILLLLISLFLILKFVYNGGRFTITLDPQSTLQTGLIIYEDPEEKRTQRRLFADELDFMDNISVKWLPKNLHEYRGGGHNGQNYIAYTFYIENTGKRVINYWYEVDIDDVIKNVDEAIRLEIFLNDKSTIYGKINKDTKTEEEGTKAFYDENIAVLEEREAMKPKDIDKMTIVIWLEGDDPDCLNNLIGGEIKMHMDIIEDHIKQEKKKNE